MSFFSVPLASVNDLKSQHPGLRQPPKTYSLSLSGILSLLFIVFSTTPASLFFSRFTSDFFPPSPNFLLASSHSFVFFTFGVYQLYVLRILARGPPLSSVSFFSSPPDISPTSPFFPSFFTFLNRATLFNLLDPESFANVSSESPQVVLSTVQTTLPFIFSAFLSFLFPFRWQRLHFSQLSFWPQNHNNPSCFNRHHTSPSYLQCRSP